MKGMILLTENESNKKYDYTPVFKLNLAGWLMQRGFILHYCKRNERNPQKIVYYFVSGSALDKAIAEYKSIH